MKREVECDVSGQIPQASHYAGTMAMSRPLALIRAINVGGRSTIAMSDVRELFESCGLTDVSTYIQTGNVLFRAPAAARPRLKNELEAKLESALERPATVFILTPAELQ